MHGIIESTAGGYRCIPAVPQYSLGAAADPGFEIERARFLKPVPLAEAFEFIARHLADIGRPGSALLHCELRSPAPVGEQEFQEFNRRYIALLDRLGVRNGEKNPVARTNVCPIYDPPDEPSVFAFSYTVATSAAKHQTFSLSGCSDSRPGLAPYRERIVRPGDTSAEGMREKVSFVIGQLEQRLKTFGFNWRDVTTTHVYTVNDFGSVAAEELGRRGGTTNGMVWYPVRPPLVGLDFEMDVRRVAREVVL